MEAEADEPEFFTIHELKLHADFVPFHDAIEDELARQGLLKREIGLWFLSKPRDPSSRGKKRV